VAITLSSPTSEDNARAAAIGIDGVMSVDRASSSPRNTPGKVSTLLI
jgi:hypothetical protein